MLYTHRIDPVAAEEYENAYDWYDKKSKAAADKFEELINLKIEAICSDPFRSRRSA